MPPIMPLDLSRNSSYSNPREIVRLSFPQPRNPFPSRPRLPCPPNPEGDVAQSREQRKMEESYFSHTISPRARSDLLLPFYFSSDGHGTSLVTGITPTIQVLKFVIVNQRWSSGFMELLLSNLIGSIKLPTSKALRRLELPWSPKTELTTSTGLALLEVCKAKSIHALHRGDYCTREKESNSRVTPIGLLQLLQRNLQRRLSSHTMTRLNVPDRLPAARLPQDKRANGKTRTVVSSLGKQSFKLGSLKLNASSTAPKSKSKPKKRAQKAKDESAREGLDGEEGSLRAAMMAEGKDEVMEVVEKPKELSGGGDGLAALMSKGL
ncbi:hypothetical protein P7C70_g6775, partial [Phenoliferia sp. Uapishka_3]